MNALSAPRRERSMGFAQLGALVALAAGVVFAAGSACPRAAWAQAELFVTNALDNSITVYARAATGNAAPRRVIRGEATQLSHPAGVAVDTVHDEVLVANTGTHSITVYRRTASGNATPLRAISGDRTRLAGPFGLVVDTVHDELLVANLSIAGGNSVTVYSRTANGDAAPLRVIEGVDTGLNEPEGLALDAVHDELFVANATPSVTVYKRMDDGNVAPVRSITGGSTGFGARSAVAVDAMHDEVLVTGFFIAPSVAVFGRLASGDAIPLRSIAGPATGLNGPTGLALDLVNDEVAVANSGNSSVTVYRRTASGEVMPLRTLNGNAAELDGPVFPAITAAVCPSRFDIDWSGNEHAECFRDLDRASEVSAGLDVGGTGHTALNFTGSTGAAAGTWLTVYDAMTPTADEESTSSVDTLCADVLIERFNNVKGVGVVALLHERVGRRGLALLLYDAGNTDTLVLATVEGDPAKHGKLTPLQGTSLRGAIAENSWYRLILTVDPAQAAVTGAVFKHATATDPNSALAAQVGGTLAYRTVALPAGVTSPGAHGIVASAVNAVLNASVTNFTNDASRCTP